MTRVLAALATAGLVLLSAGCDAQPPAPTPSPVACEPRTPDEAVADVANFDGGVVVVGVLVRYVGAPNLQARGYDIDIREVLHGDPERPTIFVRVPDELPGIRRGQSVLVAGVQAENRIVIVAADDCPPIQPIPAPSVRVPPVGPEARCENAELGYRLAYPADWFVHEANEIRGTPPCALFGPEPFEFEPDDPEQQPAVRVSAYSGACLEFDLVMLPVSHEEVTVGGRSAFRVHGGPPPGDNRHYGYIVNLGPADVPPVNFPGQTYSPSGDECAPTRGLYISAFGTASGDFDEHRRVVDRMATTLELIGD